MARRSRYNADERGAEISDLLDAVDKLLERTKVLYEQYFMGIQKVAPTQLHKDVERKIRELTQQRIRNTALRYRLTTLTQRFGVYNSYWRRTMREIEQGRYFRDVARVHRKAMRRGEDVPDEILLAMPKLMRERVLRQREALARREEHRQAHRGGDHPDAAEMGKTDYESGIYELDDDDLMELDDMSEVYAELAESAKEAVSARSSAAKTPRPGSETIDNTGDLSSDAIEDLVEDALTTLSAKPASAAPLETQPAFAQAKTIIDQTSTTLAAIPLPEGRAPSPDVDDPYESYDDAYDSIGVSAAPAADADREDPLASSSTRDTIQEDEESIAALLRAGDRAAPRQQATPSAEPAPDASATGGASRPQPALRGAGAFSRQARARGITTPPTGVGRPPAASAPASASSASASRASRPAASRTKTPEAAPPGMTASEARTLYDRYIEARRLVGASTDNLTYDKMVNTLSQQSPRIMKQYNASRVEYDVVIKQDKVILKAKPKPE